MVYYYLCRVVVGMYRHSIQCPNSTLCFATGVASAEDVSDDGIAILQYYVILN